jgi:Fur family ferric uptake transcriptional regulator
MLESFPASVVAASESGTQTLDAAAFRNFLYSRNFRLTRQRLAIAKAVITGGGRNMNAAQVYEAVKKTDPGIGLATVYKNLLMFEREGFLNHIESTDKTAHYELNDRQPLHLRLICIECGKVTELSDSRVKSALESMGSKEHFSLKRGDVNFYGICRDCSRLSLTHPKKSSSQRKPTPAESAVGNSPLLRSAANAQPLREATRSPCK